MIEPMVYPGSVEDFRCFMLDLESSLRDKAREWDGPGLEVFFGHHDIFGLVTEHYNFERSSIWQYEIFEFTLSPIGMSDEPIGSGLIVAIQIKPSETAIRFYDGVGYFESGNINPTILPHNFFAEEFGLSFGESWPENTYLLLPKPDGVKLFNFAPAGQSFQDYIDLIKQKTEPQELIAHRGPKAVPKEVRRKYIREWKLREGEITLLAYCKEIGVGVSTFRDWRSEEKLAAK